MDHLAERHDGDDGDEFLDWLKKHKLHTYKQALEQEGFEVLESLIGLSQEQVDALGTAIHMKMGHKMVFPVAIEEAREAVNGRKEEMKEEEAERKEQRKREKAKHEREEEREDAKREREEELAEKLAQIKREQKLAQAKAQSKKYLKEDQNSKLDPKPPGHDPKGLGMSVSKAKIQGIHLPSTKSYAAFISHKKTHSTQGDSSSTLARSLKVRNCEVYVFAMVSDPILVDRTC
jgi:hypothetical protein